MTRPAHANQSRSCQNNAIILLRFGFAQTGIDVTADIDYRKIRTQMQQLSLAAQTAGANPGTSGHLFEISIMPGNKDIARVDPFRYHGYLQTVREFSGQVFHAVHGDIDFLSEGDLAAIEALDGMMLEGRNLRVNEARPRPERGDRGGSRGGRGW